MDVDDKFPSRSSNRVNVTQLCAAHLRKQELQQIRSETVVEIHDRAYDQEFVRCQRADGRISFDERFAAKGIEIHV